MAAHPADLTRWNACDQGIRRNLTIDDGARRNECETSDRYSANDRAIGAQGCPLADQSLAIFVLPRNMGSGIIDVGEDHAGPAENIILQRHIVIDRDVVLDLDVVADDNPIAD